MDHLLDSLHTNICSSIIKTTSCQILLFSSLFLFPTNFGFGCLYVFHEFLFVLCSVHFFSQKLIWSTRTVLGKVILWLIGKSKRSSAAAAGTVNNNNCERSQNVSTGQSTNECDQQQQQPNQDGGVNASLLQSNANSVDQIDQDVEAADLNLLWHPANNGHWR